MIQHMPTHFSEVIQNRFQSRALKNSAYSLRAFARDLTLTPSGLSQILTKKVGLSPRKAAVIGKRLGLVGDDLKFFLTLVSANCARKKAERQASAAKLWKFDTEYTNLSAEYFKLISDWHHLALVELVRVKGFKFDYDWIAARLGIEPAEAEAAVARLLKLRFLNLTNGALVQAYDYMALPGGAPLEAARKFHTQILENAARAIHVQKVEERDYSAGFLRVRISDLPKIKARIKAFKRELSKEIESGDGHDSIYAFAIQFFRGDRATR